MEKKLIDILLERAPKMTDEERQESLQEGQERMDSLQQELLDSLTPHEQKVLDMRFGLVDDETLPAVTQERIKEIQDKALQKLRSRVPNFSDTLD